MLIHAKKTSFQVLEMFGDDFDYDPRQGSNIRASLYEQLIRYFDALKRDQTAYAQDKLRAYAGTSDRRTKTRHKDWSSARDRLERGST